MKAVVTGAAGFVGKHLIDHLAKEGDVVVGLDTSNGPDLRNAELWQQLDLLADADVLYHLAGWSSVGKSWDNPSAVNEINVEGTQNVLAASQKWAVKTVVLASSAEVYAGVSDKPITETDQTAPRSPYAESKLKAEALGINHAQHSGQRVIITRPFNQIGPGQSQDFVVSSFASQIVAIERGLETQIQHGNLEAIRDFTDVRKSVSAYRLLAQHGISGEIYNICSGQGHSIAEVLNQLKALAKVDIHTELDPDRNRPSDCPIKIGDNQKLMEATGWKPSIALSKTLGDVIEAERSASSS